MPKQDTRQIIIQNGAKIIHSKGFVNTGIKDILDASGVPKGSFYFYFKSKEDFGQALVDYYAETMTGMITGYLTDTGRTPMERLDRFFTESARFYEHNRFAGGCPIGNMSQEMSNISEPIRLKLQAAFSRIRSAMKQCIIEAQELGQVDEKLDPEVLAVFTLNGFEGALIDMKVSKSTRPLDIFKNMLLEFIKQK
jgi:TetR/AcrR family transcriptional repressor of nem operon